ncbi:MAG TPA: SRPBCC family protein [Burkholderiales bacterium]|nr:SRPBCC family protein [Burkholderiales bacterium]
MFKTLAIVVAVLIAGVLMFAATKPDTFRVQRSAAIKAPPEKVFTLINDFKAWGAWSPWEKKDPAMKRTFGATTVGKGAHYAWEGNKNVGQGSMTITESAPSSKIALNLDFLKPFEAHNIVEFTLAVQGDTTNVTWTMHGPANFVSKLIQVFMSMDNMVGKDFEAGLANLKAAAEK